jgi:hypothetical protein
MLDILSGGLLGTIVGGAFRLVPEFIKLVDKKAERSHELRLTELTSKIEMERETAKLSRVVEENRGTVDNAVLNSFNAAIEQQAEMTKAAGPGFVTSFTSLVRPTITYWVLLVWSFMHLWLAFSSTGDVKEIYSLVMTPDFVGLVGATTNYWFLDRTLKTRGL